MGIEWGQTMSCSSDTSVRVSGPFGLAALVFFFSAIVLTLVMPLAAVFWRLRTGASVSMFFDPVVMSVVRVTAGQAALSTLISLLLGLPLGLAVSRMAGLWWSFSRALLAIPYTIPTVVVALVGVSWLGRSGVLALLGLQLDWAFSLKGIVAAHVFLNAPWVALAVAEARRQVLEDELQAASTLGAGWRSRAWSIVRPSIQWSVLSVASQVFALCTMSFALVLLLGGGPPVETLETTIYSRIRLGSLDLGGAAVCAAWELLLTLVPWLVILFLRKKKRGGLRSIWRGPRIQRRGTGCAVLGLCLLPVIPYLAVLDTSTWRTWTTRLTGEELHVVGAAFATSIQLAAASAALAFAIVASGLTASFRYPRLRTPIALFASVPSGVSILVLGLGFWLAYQRWIDPFNGSFVAIAVLQSAILTPLMLRLLWPLSLAVSVRELDAAHSLGASPIRAFFTVEWPRWRSTVISALALGFGASLGEVAAVSLFYSEKLIPLSLQMSRWTAQYRFDEARALGALLLVMSGGTAALVMLFGTENNGEMNAAG